MHVGTSPRSPLPAGLLTVLLIFAAGLPGAFAGDDVPEFPERQQFKLVPAAFTDAQIAKLTTTLDAILAADPDPAHWAQPLWEFARRLQAGPLSAAQEARVLAHLDRIAKEHPAATEAVAGSRYMVRSLTVGKTAPDIVGTSLDGRPMRLSDYRGKVVVLTFGAEWCGICRSMFPYERLMLELYKNWPFAMLSVETGSSPESVSRVREAERLTYPAWWDEPSETGPGPIATKWNVAGVPTVYVLDGRGVIRFVDVREEDLLKSVRQLLHEPSNRVASNDPQRNKSN